MDNKNEYLLLLSDLKYFSPYYYIYSKYFYNFKQLFLVKNQFHFNINEKFEELNEKNFKINEEIKLNKTKQKTKIKSYIYVI